MTIEQRLEQLEKRNKRLTVALTMMAVVVCSVVTMAATGLKDGNFDTVTARTIFVENDAGKIVVSLGANDGGDILPGVQIAAEAREIAAADIEPQAMSGLKYMAHRTQPDHKLVDLIGLQ